MKDFIEGRDKRYVKATKRKVSWDKGLTNYSEYYFGGMKFRDKNDMIIRAIDLARSIVKSMGLKEDIYVQFGTTEVSVTNGKRVIIATRMFDSPVLTDYQKIDLFISDIIHEIAHLNYTNFSVRFPTDKMEKALFNIIEDERIEMREVEVNPGYSNFISAGKVHEHNEMLEELIKSKKAYREFAGEDAALLEFVQLIFSLIRYPPGMDPDEAIEYADDLEAVKKILTPYPNTTLGAKEASEEVGAYMRKRFRKIIEDALKKKEKEKRDKEKRDKDKKEGKSPIKMTSEMAEAMFGDCEPGEGEPGDSDIEIEITDGKGKKSDEPDEDGSSKKSEKAGKKSDKTDEEDSGEEDSEDSEDSSDIPDIADFVGDGTGGDSEDESTEDDEIGAGEEIPKDADKERSERPDGETLPKVPSEVSGHDELSETDGHDDPVKEIPKEKIDKSVREEIRFLEIAVKHIADDTEIRNHGDSKTFIEATGEFADKDIRIAMEKYFEDADSIYNRKVFFIDVPAGKSDVYNETKMKVTGFAGKIKTVLKFRHRDEEINMKGMTSGSLDVNRLAEAVQGDTHVYETFGELVTEKGAVILLIDESGSMAGACARLAMEAGIVMCEALNKNPDIDLYIYGFSSDQTFSGSTEVYVYKEGYKYPRHGLTNVRGRSQNRDGDAIEAVSVRVRKLTKRAGVMFMISDGEPSAHGYGGSSAIRHMKKCIVDSTKRGIPVVGIAIYAYNETQKIYDTVFVIKNVSELPKELGKIAKEIISKIFKIKLTEA